MDVPTFQSFIWDFYKNHGRKFAWRNVANPYYVVVSEMMLQQTQTRRVEERYEKFIATFTTFESLANASLRDVLSAWQGLGYYRRARFLHHIAQKVIDAYEGDLPNDTSLLQTFPGIGKATAASICAFAFNKPTVFIETNIRTVFIHSFFKDHTDVHDKLLLPLIEQTLDHVNSREWYYALMDYGVWLKRMYPNPNRRSAHYAKQSTFEGSDRQIRAKVLKLIVEQGSITQKEILARIGQEQERVVQIIEQLENEQFIRLVNRSFTVHERAK